MKFCQLALVLASLAVVGVGCALNRPYRTSLPIDTDSDIKGLTNNPRAAYINSVTNAAIETNNVVVGPAKTDRFDIGYVEFDDQGWFWGHSQWEKVRSRLLSEADVTNSPNGITVVVFVHGWKNNADYRNPNVETFRSVLTNLCRDLAPRRVFGVYVGWRGQSTKYDWFPPLGEELTFYRRKAAAERIGHEGAATQLFTELQIIQDEHNHTTPIPSSQVTNTVLAPTNLTNRMGLIVIGHSFGGQLVFSAISQVFTERLLIETRHATNATENTIQLKPVHSFGDLVILLSPAFEASLYNNLIALATSKDIKYSKDQRPVLAIFTSKGDWPNHYFFPIGRFFPSLFNSTRPSSGPDETNLFNITKGEPPNQRRAFLRTVGFDSDYVTWNLNYATNFSPYYPVRRDTNGAMVPMPYWEATDRPNLGTNQNSGNATDWNARTNKVPRAYSFNNFYLTTNAHNGLASVVTNYYACVLEPCPTNHFFTPDLVANNPLLNVQVDKKIMSGHGDIANPFLLRFLQDFIEFATSTNSIETGVAHPEARGGM